MPASVLLVRLLARGPQTLHRSFDRRPARRALGDFGFRGFFGHPLEMLFVQRCEERSLGLGGEVFVGIDLQQHDPVWILHQEEQIIRPPAPEVQVHYAERVEQRIVVPVDPGPVEAVGKGSPGADTCDDFLHVVFESAVGSYEAGVVPEIWGMEHTLGRGLDSRLV